MSQFFNGIIVGILLLSTALEIFPSYHKMAVEAKLECEKKLPRNVHCKVTAIAMPEPEALK